MTFPRTPPAILRAALISVLTATAMINAVLLLAMPDWMADLLPTDVLPDLVARALGLGSIVLAFLMSRRVTRVAPLLMLTGTAGFPVMTAAVQARPDVAAGMLMTAVVVGCILLDRAWLEAVWAGRRF